MGLSADHLPNGQVMVKESCLCLCPRQWRLMSEGVFVVTVAAGDKTKIWRGSRREGDGNRGRGLFISIALFFNSNCAP